MLFFIDRNQNIYTAYYQSVILKKMALILFFSDHNSDCFYEIKDDILFKKNVFKSSKREG